MEKNTKILLGVGAVIALYLILKPKKAVGQSDLREPLEDAVTPPPPPVDTGKKTAVEPATKPCEVIYYNCTPNPRIEIIQIPYDDEKCDRLIRYGGYQPDPPPCAPRGDDDNLKLQLFQPMQF
jgi:hypothetical protein